MAQSTFDESTTSPQTDTDRRMVRAELLGRHSHRTASGICVHVWRRHGRYLARGSYQGRRFGKTLVGTFEAAEAELRRLLTEIEVGSFVSRSDARKRPLARGGIPRLRLRHL